MPTIPVRLARLGKELLVHSDVALMYGDPGDSIVIKISWNDADALQA